jgi:hypothetical protein
MCAICRPCPSPVVSSTRALVALCARPRALSSRRIPPTLCLARPLLCPCCCACSSVFPACPARVFLRAPFFPSSDFTIRHCPIRVSTLPRLCSSSSSTLCCRFDCRRCCVPRYVLAGCRLLYPSTHSCLPLACVSARAPARCHCGALALRPSGFIRARVCRRAVEPVLPCS